MAFHLVMVGVKNLHGVLKSRMNKHAKVFIREVMLTEEAARVGED